MQDAIGHALVREELVKRGATSEEIQALLKDVDLKTQQVKNGTAVAADASKGFWGAYVMAFMLYFAVVFYGVNVAHSVVAEKTSRVFEVMLASAKPESLMLGKLLGVGAVGLTQMAIWIVFVLLLSASSLWTTLGLGGLAAYGVTPLQLIFFVLYFILGFFFYSALSAGLGATVSQESEVQQFSMIIVLPQVIGLALIVYILSNPGAWPVVLLSLFPPCTPIVMCFAHGGDGGAGVATRSLPGADGVVHLRDGVGGYADLPRRHPDVWQAADAAGDVALAKVQLIPATL